MAGRRREALVRSRHEWRHYSFDQLVGRTPLVKGLVSHRTKRRIESIIVRFSPSRRANPVAVLCYHGVDPRFSYSSVEAGGASLRQHLEWLSEYTEVVPLDRVITAAKDPSRHKPIVAITFDDGYLDNYEVAFPALMELDLPATFFLTTGLLDRDEWVINHLASLWGTEHAEIETMTWQQAAEMQQAGMEIGAHTLTHRRLAGMDKPEAAEEIRSSRTKLESFLGVPVTSFAYPFGKPRQHFTPNTVLEVAEAGFARAVSVLYRGVRADEDPLAIPRIPITNDSLTMLERKVQGRLDIIGLWQENAPTWAARALSVDVAEPPGGE